MDWMLMPLRRYAQFSGRSRRKEYWLFALLYFVIYIVAAVVDYTLGYGAASTAVADGSATANFSSWGPATLVVTLVLLIPSIAVGIRRLHDTDRRGWWVLIGLVPLIGGIVLLVFFCLDGTAGANRFGPDPKAGEHPEARAAF